MKLSKQQAVEEHRKMWNWIADETLKRKRIVTKEEYFNEVYSNSSNLPPVALCFCCEYAEKIIGEIEDEDTSEGIRECSLYCPIKWPGGRCISYKYYNNPSFISPNAGLLYPKWVMADNYEKAAEYARMIAELPEREDDEKEDQNK